MADLPRIALFCVAAGVIGWGCGTDAPKDSAYSKPDVAAVASEPLQAPDLENRSFPLLIWGAWSVQQEYFDPNRIEPREQLLSALQFLALSTPEFFYRVDASKDEVEVTVRAGKARFSLAGLKTLVDAAERAEDILEFTQSVLSLEPEPLHELEYTALNGMFASLDPHTVLLTPEEHADLGVRTRGHFGGVGAEIRAEDRRIRLVRVIEGGPAAKAGLLAGDLLLKIGSQSTVNMTSVEAQQLLRGPVGDPVSVRVRRGKEALGFRVVRDTIKIPSVRDVALPGGVAYLQISTFQEDTGEHVRRVLKDAQAGEAGLKAVVIDLRGNTGGLLTQATAVVDALVTHGALVVVKSAMGREEDVATAATAVPEAVPVVVLVDEESASAAEIVSGGLQALSRAVVVGRGSFGKGSVQMLKPASPYGRELALKLTVAHYLVNGDREIQTRGVIPDLELLPVEVSHIPGVARYYDLERFEQLRERARVANLPSAKHDGYDGHPPRPDRSLHYLWTTEFDGLDLADATAEQALPDELRDPEVRLALAVAQGMAAAPGGKLASVLDSLLPGLRAAEDGRIARALSEASVVWSASPASTVHRLDVTAVTLGDEPVVMGEAFRVRVTIHNPGETPASKVHLITECEKDELDGIELMVGDVPAGATVERTLELALLSFRDSFTDSLDVDVHVGEPDDKPDGEARLMLEASAPPRPRLAYDYWVVDDTDLARRAPARPPSRAVPGEAPFVVEGNGDGVLQAGERVLLAFRARNVGDGVASDARAILRNLSGQQGLLEEGSLELGELQPGAEAVGAFGISISPQADPAQPLELNLMVGDARARENVHHKLRLSVAANTASAEPQPTRVVAKGPVRLYIGADSDTRVAVEFSEGTVLESAGRIDKWLFFERSQKGRRLYGPADLFAAAPRAGKPVRLSDAELRLTVEPPQIAVTNAPAQTKAATVTLTGTVTHPRRVRDVMIAVLPPGSSQIERKIYYEANPSSTGADAQRLSFSTEVPLQPGGNRVTIVARDGEKVEGTRDVWIYSGGP